jgi:D-aminopeptidase
MTKSPFAAILISTAAVAQNAITLRASLGFGLKAGVLPTGPLDAITDVAGVEVGREKLATGIQDIKAVRVYRHSAGRLFYRALSREARVKTPASRGDFRT